MVDTVASLGLELVGTDIERATSMLDSFSASAEGAERATNSLGATSDRATSKITSTGRATSQIVAILERMERSLKDIAGSVAPLAASMDKLNTNLSKMSDFLSKDISSLKTFSQETRDATRAIEALQRAAGRPVGPPALPSGTSGAGNTPRPSTVPSRPSTAPSASQGLSPFQAQQLLYQLSDVISSAGSISPMRIAFQQGPQLGQMFTGPNAITRDQLLTSLTAFATRLNPLTVAIGALTVSAVAAGSALVSYSNRQYDLARVTSIGAGRRSGLTAGDITGFASAANPWQMSTSEARGAFSSFVGSGMNRGSATASGSLLFGLAQASNSSIEDAASSLATAYRDGAKGVIKLVSEYATLSDAQRSMIEGLYAAGKSNEGYMAALDILSNELRQAAVEAPLWRQGLTRLGNWASNAVDSFIENTGRGASRASRLLNTEIGLGPSSTNARSRRPSAVYDPSRAGENITVQLPPDATSAIAASIAKLATDATATARARAETASRDSNTISESVSKYAGEAKELEALRKEYEKLETATKNADAMALLSKETREGLASAMARLKGQIDNFSTAEQDAARSFELGVQATRAYTAEQKLAAISAQRMEEVSKNKTLSHMKEAEAQRAVTLEMEKWTATAQNALRSAQDAYKSSGMLPWQKQMTDLATERDRNIAQFGNAALYNQIYKTNAATAQNNVVGGAMTQSKLQLNEQVAALKLQRDTFYLSAEATAEAAAKQEMLNNFIRQGINPTGDLLRQIEGLAKQYGKVAGEADKFRRESQNIVQGMDEIRGTGRGALTGLVTDIAQGKNALDGLNNSLVRLQSQLVDRLVTKPFMDSLLGEEGKPGGGLIGGFVSQLFGTVKPGLPSGVSTAPITGLMTVNAATVIVTGGVASGVGGMVGALGANNGAGGFTGAGSGLLGFGLGGAQSSGAQAMSSGLSAFGFGPNGVGMGAGAMSGTAGRVYAGLVARGFSPVQAAAAAGNINAESGFKTSIEGDKGLAGGSSFGLMQWREGRLANLKNFASSQGKNWTDLDTQMDFMKREATGGDLGFTNWFRQTGGATSPSAAASSFATMVERPSAKALAESLGKRTGYAEQYYRQFGSGTQSVPGAGTVQQMPWQQGQGAPVNFEAAAASFKSSTDMATQGMQTAQSGITEMTKAAAAVPEGTQAATQGLGNLLNSLNTVPQTTQAGGGGLLGWIGGLFGGGSAGTNARGTDDWRGGRTWVGEEGPELLTLPRGSRITPADSLPGVPIPYMQPVMQGGNVYVSNNNYAEGVRVETKERRDENGNRRIQNNIYNDAIAAEISRPGSRAQQAARNANRTVPVRM